MTDHPGEYWYAVAGRRFGPHFPAEFDGLLRTGRIPAGAWVYPPGADHWVPLGEAMARFPPSATAGRWPAPTTQPLLTGAAPAVLTPVNGMAVTCFVLALVSIPTALVLVGFVLALAAVVLGHLSLRELRHAQDRQQPQRGRGMAIAALAIGYTMLAGCALLIIAIVIPVPRSVDPVPSGDAVVQADLRDAAIAQESVFAETQRYTASVGVLRANGFLPTSGAEFRVTADAASYCVSAFRSGQTTYHYDSRDPGPEPGPCSEQLL